MTKMDKILPKSSFSRWLKSLSSMKVFFPKKEASGWTLTEVAADGTIPPDYSYAVVPPKKLIFPQEEIFFEFQQTADDGLQLRETLPEVPPQVIVGVRPCDGRAVAALDQVFSGSFEDPYYWRRRRATILIGLACNTPPSNNCFCLSLEGSPSSEEGLDLLLTDLGDRYYVRVLTEKGGELIKTQSSLFSDPTEEEKNLRNKISQEGAQKIKRNLEAARELPPKLKTMFDSPFWDEAALSCLRCGICTYLCPTCHCFDINDETRALAPLKGRRVRTWDTCQFPDFTMHSSGHNPRPNRASRLRQRLLHKFLYFVELYDRFQCVGCGRCLDLCPVGIDIIEVLSKARNHGA